MKRKSSVNKGVIFSIVALVLLLLAILYYQMMRFMPSRERVSVKSELKIGAAGEYAICLNGKYIEPRAYDDEGLYLPLSVVKQNINNRFYYNADEENIFYSMPNETLTIDYKTLYNEPYLLQADVLAHSRAGINIREQDNVMSVTTQDFAESTRIVRIKKDSALRKKGGIKSPILFDVKKGEKAFVLEEMNKWNKVATFDGRIGYIKKSELGADIKLETSMLKDELGFMEISAESFSHQVRDYKISLGWNLMMNESGNSRLEQTLKNTKGLNVISPTWFSVKDNDGNIVSFADKAYVKKAHDMKLEVWGLLGNLTYKEAKSKVFLHKSKSRRNIIEKTVEEAKRVGLDGINLDFEAIPESAAEDFIQFVRELSIECRKNKLVLSVDNYVPKSFNQYYNRKEQEIFADYIVIMGYDEHYAGSNKAGSVASIGFVEDGIDETLKDVAADRIINALPFYMRVWTNTTDGLKSKSISMHQAKELINKNKLSLSFDDVTGQSYAEYDSENGFCQIWFEDAKSLNVKMNMIKAKGIGGIAFWRLGLETEDVWDIVDINNLK